MLRRTGSPAHWAYARRAARFGYGTDTISLLSTPLYSNTTLVVFFPALSFGGTVVLMPEFDANKWLDLAEIRTGDVGRFDDDGFLVLMDRRKDMIISGGFNVYPSDLEAELRAEPSVADVAVVGVPSAR